MNRQLYESRFNRFKYHSRFGQQTTKTIDSADVYVTKVLGPSTICGGGIYQYTVTKFNVEKLDIRTVAKAVYWGYQVDDGTIIDLKVQSEVVAGKNEILAKIKIHPTIKGQHFKVYAWLHKPSPIVFAGSSILSYPFIFKKYKEKGLDKDALKIADDMCYGDGVTVTEHFRYSREEIENLGFWMEYGTLTDSVNSLWIDFYAMAKNFFSVGALEKVAVAMIDHFKQSKGTDFSHPTLTSNVLKHHSTTTFCNWLEDDMKKKLKSNSLSDHPLDKGPYNPIFLLDDKLIKYKVLSNKPQYESVKDTFLGGLQFCMGDTWAYKVQITGFDRSYNNKCTVQYKVLLYDHFGLNIADIQKPQIYLGAGFRAWFVLQHIHNYRPFVTVVEFDKKFTF